MKNLFKYALFIFLFVGISSFSLKGDLASKPYKVLIQMKNYVGEGAYIVVSVLDQNNKYVKTLQVLGDDSEWYSDIAEWWKFQANKKLSDIDAISGATVSGGERSTFTIHIDDKYMNKGYKLRFETAVEEVEYHAADIEIPLTATGLRSKPEGKGFIRYVRMMPLK